MVKLTAKNIKIIKTCNLYLCFCVLGLCISLPGPTLLDLQSIVNTTTSKIALVYTGRSIGYLVGSVVGGIIFDWLSRKQLIMTLFHLFVSFTMFAIPWSRSIGILTTFMIANGIALGILDTGGNVCCLNLWGKESGPFFQALHFAFGVGGLLGPLVASPFLDEITPESLNSQNNSTAMLNLTFKHSLDSNFSNSILQYNLHSNFSNSALNLFSNASFVTSPSLPSITYAYSIIGGIALLVSILFLTICIISPVDEGGEKSDEATSKNYSRSFIIGLVFLLVILMFVETGTEIGYSQMLTTYAVKGGLKLPKVTGSYMTSAFWAAFTVSRLLSIFLAIKMSSFSLIICDIVVMSIGAVILVCWAGTQTWALWLATVIIGVGIASFFPAAIGWIDNYIPVTNKIASCFTVGAALGEMVVPFLVSHYIEEVPEVLLYVVPMSCILAVVLTSIVYILLRKKGVRQTNEEIKPSPDNVVNA